MTHNVYNKIKYKQNVWHSVASLMWEISVPMSVFHMTEKLHWIDLKLVYFWALLSCTETSSFISYVIPEVIIIIF